MKSMKKFGWISVMVLLAGSLILASCGDAPGNEPPTLTGITVSPNNFILSVDEELQLTVTAVPKGAKLPSIVWDSDDTAEAVVTVSTGGKVKGISKGTAKITATAGAFSAAADVRVVLSLEEAKEEATEAFLDAVTSGDLSEISLEDFEDMGIEGIDEHNLESILDLIQDYLDNLPAGIEVEDLDDIKALVDIALIMQGSEEPQGSQDAAEEYIKGLAQNGSELDDEIDWTLVSDTGGTVSIKVKKGNIGKFPVEIYVSFVQPASKADILATLKTRIEGRFGSGSYSYTPTGQTTIDVPGFNILADIGAGAVTLNNETITVYFVLSKLNPSGTSFLFHLSDIWKISGGGLSEATGQVSIAISATENTACTLEYQYDITDDDDGSGLTVTLNLTPVAEYKVVYETPAQGTIAIANSTPPDAITAAKTVMGQIVSTTITATLTPPNNVTISPTVGAATGGIYTFTPSSQVYTITVKQTQEAELPSITTQPQSASYLTTGSPTITPLTVAATVTDGGTPTYQWYSNTVNNNTSGSVATGTSTNASYTPAGATSANTTYYYCVVTNTKADHDPSAPVASSVAAITFRATDPLITVSGVPLSVAASGTAAATDVTGNSHTTALAFNTAAGTNMGKFLLNVEQAANVTVVADAVSGRSVKVQKITVPNTTGTTIPVATGWETATGTLTSSFTGKDYIQVQYNDGNTTVYYSIYPRRTVNIPYVASGVISVTDGNNNTATIEEEGAWANAVEIVLDRVYMPDSSGLANVTDYDQSNPETHPKIKLLWSDDGLYVLAKVKDTNNGTATEHNGDSLEVFISESFAFGNSGNWQNTSTGGTTGGGGGQYRVSRSGATSGNPSTVTSRTTREVSSTTDGYTIKAKLAWQLSATAENNKMIGFDASINYAQGTANRSAQVIWNNFFEGSYNQRGNCGIAYLVGK